MVICGWDVLYEQINEKGKKVILEQQEQKDLIFLRSHHWTQGAHLELGQCWSDAGHFLPNQSFPLSFRENSSLITKISFELSLLRIFHP